LEYDSNRCSFLTFKNIPTRLLTTPLVSSFVFISTLSSSICAPASEQIGKDLQIESSELLAMTTSIFVLAYAFGPLIAAPLSEIYGRTIVLQIGSTIFTLFNLACAFAPTQGSLIAFRFLAGVGGSPPPVIGGSILGDLWRPEERGRAMSVYSLAPLLGPAIGPVAGGFIAQYTTWRWVFRATTIISASIQIIALLWYKESESPRNNNFHAYKLYGSVCSNSFGATGNENSAGDGPGQT
jgi:multidrug resistance protein